MDQRLGINPEYYEYREEQERKTNPTAAQNKPLQVPITKNCDELCGPDVTKWFLKDLKFIQQAADQRIKELNERYNMERFGVGPPVALAKWRAEWFTYWQEEVKYNMSYKWMDFSGNSGCGTGRCVNTVMLAGICMRKNQLGNIAFGWFTKQYPPWILGFDPFNWAYGTPEIGTYSADHQWSVNYQNVADGGPDYTGLNRADNLAAWGVGASLAGEQGTVPDEAALKAAVGGNKEVNTFADIFAKGAKFTTNTLTFIPEFRGFNTQSCKPCGKTYSGPMTSRTMREKMWAAYIKGEANRQT